MRSRVASVNELPVTNAPVATRFSQFWPSLRAPIDIPQQPATPASSNLNSTPKDVEQPAPAKARDEVLVSAAPPVSPVAQVTPPSAPIIRTEQMLALMVGALSLAGLIMAFTYKLATIRRPPSSARWDIAASEPRLQLQPFGHTGLLPRPAEPVHKPVAAKRANDLEREPHETRRLRELRELREDLESRLEELRHARRRTAA